MGGHTVLNGASVCRCQSRRRDSCGSAVMIQRLSALKWLLGAGVESIQGFDSDALKSDCGGGRRGDGLGWRGLSGVMR